MDIALYHAQQRKLLGTYSLGDIDESNMFGFAGMEINLGPVMINPSVRVDWFHFNYADKTAEQYDDKGTAQAFVSPKLIITYNPARNLQIYLKGGRGFHSNDARVVVVRDGKNVLPQALGAECLWQNVLAVSDNDHAGVVAVEAAATFQVDLKIAGRVVGYDEFRADECLCGAFVVVLFGCFVGIVEVEPVDTDRRVDHDRT